MLISFSRKKQARVVLGTLATIMGYVAGEARGQNGACCFPNTTCTVTSPSSCTTFGGQFVGGRDCTPGLCPGSGACCLPDGTCNQLSPAACASASGEYNGNSTLCSNQNCVGACCLPDKGCIETGSGDCAQLEGAFAGRRTICGDDCPTAMPTAFTYQGQLSQGGVPLNDVVDARFSLWLSPEGQDPANQIGGTLQKDLIDVVDGLFQAEIDFGQAAFNGNARWLQIELRDSGTSDPFTVLLPRVSLNPAPYALQTRGITVLENGNVGIGTKQPGAPLHIKKQAGPGTGTLALDGDTQAFMTFFLNTLIPGRKGYVGFESFPHLTIANEQLGGRIVLSTPGSSVFATGGEENLRVIRGIVNADGTVRQGDGFTVVQQDQGRYLITFNSPFSGLPSVTANTEYILYSPSWATIVDPQPTRVTIRLRTTDPSDGGNFDDDYSRFHFIAVGPR